jgi:hypothetical protein
VACHERDEARADAARLQDALAAARSLTPVSSSGRAHVSFSEATEAQAEESEVQRLLEGELDSVRADALQMRDEYEAELSVRPSVRRVSGALV